jgi:hypothetical protein
MAQTPFLIFQKREGSMKPRLVDKPLVLYGKGQLGKLAVEVFEELKIPIVAIIDQATPTILCGEYLIAVCVATAPYSSIRDYLLARGATDIVPVYDIFEAYPECGIGSGWFTGKLTQEDEKGIYDVLFGLLKSKPEDHTSRYHYFQFRLWHERREEYPLSWHPITPRPGLPTTLAAIRERQGLAIFIAKEGVTPKTISIHAEGLEYETLRHNLHNFQAWRPEIDISCYHSRDGLWKIQKLLMENLKDYRFIFRLHAYLGTGAYLYAIPKERGDE